MSCETIQTRYRPVPLHWHFSYYKDKRVSSRCSVGQWDKVTAGIGQWMTEVAATLSVCSRLLANSRVGTARQALTRGGSLAQAQCVRNCLAVHSSLIAHWNAVISSTTLATRRLRDSTLTCVLPAVRLPPADPQGVQLDDLLHGKAGKQFLNPRLTRQAVLQEEARAMLARVGPGAGRNGRGGRGGRGGGLGGQGPAGGGNGNGWFDDWEQEMESLLEKDPQVGVRPWEGRQERRREAAGRRAVAWGARRGARAAHVGTGRAGASSSSKYAACPGAGRQVGGVSDPTRCVWSPAGGYGPRPAAFMSFLVPILPSHPTASDVDADAASSPVLCPMRCCPSPPRRCSGASTSAAYPTCTSWWRCWRSGSCCPPSGSSSAGAYR